MMSEIILSYLLAGIVTYLYVGYRTSFDFDEGVFKGVAYGFLFVLGWYFALVGSAIRYHKQVVEPAKESDLDDFEIPDSDELNDALNQLKDQMEDSEGDE